MAKERNTHAVGKDIGLSVGITAAAAAAAGAYFLYGSKNAKANRQKVKGWMLKAKGEVLEALEKAEQMSFEDYEQLIEDIAAAYAVVQNATKKDIAEFKREMKAHWGKIEKEAKPLKKAVKRAAASTTKKPGARSAAKKTATRAVKYTSTRKNSRS